MKELIEKINKLKKEKNAVILVHNYQRPEIYEVADYIGDSLGLSIEASKTKAKIIVFCGVDFMAESAKILNPEKKVLIPSLAAQCPMAKMISGKKVRELKKKHLDAAVMCYVNTTAETKAECDVCCTSRNYIDIANKLPNKEIIFIPDINMGKELQKHTNKKIIIPKGFCYVHIAAHPELIKKGKEIHKDAIIMAHPECPPKVLERADYVGGTEGMLNFARKNPSKEYIVVTEQGMSNRLKRELPDKEFYPAAGLCFNMKQITLEKVYKSLKDGIFEVNVPEEIRIRAKKALDRMMRIKVT